MNAARVSIFMACLGWSATALAHDTAPFKVLSLSRQSPQGRVMRSVPEFALTERSGRPVSLADLRGKIWIADFIYAQCTDTCPLQTAEMAKLQEFWTKDADLRLVSISVDPEKDTPQILARYAKRFHADSQRWLFLTGDKKQIVRLVEDGFHLPAASAVTRQGAPIVIHSPRFMLVDRDAQIRGAYDSGDRLSMQQLKADVASLLNQPVGTAENSSRVR
jgi:cytochrome oxidase Cu insertion factor (SCO1/SenC/PrrC family)